MSTVPLTSQAAVTGDPSLLEAVATNPQLPSPPGLALRVLETASQPDCSISQVSDLVARDPALCGKILQTINSALYGLPRPVASIERALKLMGLKPVRALLLGFALPSMQPRLTTADADGERGLEAMRRFWQASVAGAIVARELAIKCDHDEPEDDFVAALLRDLGLFLLQAVFPDKYATLADQPDWFDLDGQQAAERRVLGLDHADVGAYVLQRWHLPVELTLPIRYHHDPAAVPEGEATTLVCKRAELLHFASLAANLLGNPQDEAARERLLELGLSHYGMRERELTEFLDSLDGKIRELGRLLDVDLGEFPGYAAVLSGATQQLMQLAIEASLESVKAKAEASAAKREAEHWQRAAYRLRQRAVRDALTGLYNRGYFEETLVTEFKRARRRCSILGLIFLDLDGFKPLNDQFGHPFGDKVLQEVARVLRSTVRSSDVVARYGGDEYCVIVPETTLAGVEALGQRILGAIQNLEVRRGHDRGKVGASIGGVVCLPHRDTRTYEQFLAAADDAMYSVKTTGKNRVTIVSLIEAEDQSLLEEVDCRSFRTYIAANELASPEQVGQAARLVPAPGFCIGRLARRMGWLGGRKLRRVLHEQRATRDRFGEVAVRHRFLTQGQVYCLLALQRERPEEIADGLVDLGVWEEEAADVHVRQYHASLKGFF